MAPLAPLEALTPATLLDPAALRAELARAGGRAWAELVDELEQGHAALAVPIRDASGALAAMAGLSGPTFRLGRSRRRELRPLLDAAAAEIGRAVAAQRPGARGRFSPVAPG